MQEHSSGLCYNKIVANRKQQQKRYNNKFIIRFTYVLLQKFLSTAYIAKFIELYVAKWRLFRYDH